jgi:hypothetical protein
MALAIKMPRLKTPKVTAPTLNKDNTPALWWTGALFGLMATQAQTAQATSANHPNIDHIAQLNFMLTFRQHSAVNSGIRIPRARVICNVSATCNLLVIACVFS